MKKLISILMMALLCASAQAQDTKKGITSGEVYFQKAVRNKVVNKTAPYIMTADDTFVTVDTSGGSVDAISLPAAAAANAGRVYYVIKTATANTVTIEVDGGGTIDGASSIILAAKSSYGFVSNGSEWKRFAEHNIAPSTITESQISLSDVTTNNADATKHGFLRKLSGNASEVLKGDGTWGAVGGTGTVTHTGGALTSNAFILGNGGDDVKAQAITGIVLGNGGSAPSAITDSAGIAGALSDEVGSSGGGVLVFNNSPTIVTPTIASFANAAHNHTNAAGGGQITDAALSAAVGAAKGGTGIDTSALTGVPRISAGTWSANAGLSHLAASTSADLAGVLSDETGSAGGFVRATSPTFNTQITTPKVIWSGALADNFGTGSPEGVITADPGSVYRRVDGAANTMLYVKVTGTGNTGWQVLLNSASGTGDVTGPASSVDSEIALFSGIGGKTIKRATGTGMTWVNSGVLGIVTVQSPLQFSGGTLSLTGSINTFILTDGTTTLNGTSTLSVTPSHFAIADGGSGTSILSLKATGTPQFARLGLGAAADSTDLLFLEGGTTPIDAVMLNMAAPSSDGQRDSHFQVIRGSSFISSAAHTTDWRYFVDITSGAGASTFTLQSRIDAAGFANRLTITDGGTVTATLFSGSGASLTSIPEGALALTDITTNNANASRHGFLPKLSGNSTDVLKGDGTWGAAGSASQTPWTQNIDGDGFSLLDAGDLQLRNGKALQSTQTTGETIKIQGWDVDGAVRVDAFTVTNGNTVAADLASFVTIGGAAIVTPNGTVNFQNKTLTNSNNVLGAVTMTLGSDATGDIYYRNSGGLLTRLGVGSDGQVLKLSSGLPAWGTDSTGGGGGGPGQTLGFFNVTDNVAPASNFASFDTRNNHLALAFTDAADLDAVFPGWLARGYSGNGITLTIVWAGATATSGNVVWEACWERIDASGLDIDADSFASCKSATAAASATSGATTYTTIAFTNGAEIDSLVAGEAYRLKVRRIGSNGSDTMAGNAELLRVEVRETP
jgi:hypothetical protein